MFTTEQNTAKTLAKTSKNGFMKPGMALAKDVAVKHRVTYKEVTLILGILVAVMAIFILWIADPSADGQPSSHATTLPELLSGDLPRSIIYTLVDVLF
jgi:hypothetical protein